MKICNLIEHSPPSEGVYVGVKYDTDSVKKLKALIKQLKIPNEVPSSKIHTTIIYSRKYVPDIKTYDTILDIVAIPKKFTVFDTQDNKRALVIELDCEYLVDRHNAIMEEYGTTYDFEKYIPHITLSYDIGDLEFIYDFNENPIELVLTSEYTEKLILNWKTN